MPHEHPDPPKPPGGGNKSSRMAYARYVLMGLFDEDEKFEVLKENFKNAESED